MKTILNKVSFHYTYLIIAVGFVLTGYFKHLILFTSLVLVHELGHIIAMIHYGFIIDKITIYPYGGYIKTNDIIDKNIDEELIVAISGLFLQTCFYVFLSFFLSNNSLAIFRMYHYSMLILNLIPIYPLDGFKILNLYLNKFMSYRLANYISFFISILFLIPFICFGYKNYSYYMIFVMLIYNIINFYKTIEYLYNKFLLERYLYKTNYKKVVIISKIKNLRRNRLNYIKNRDILVKEDKILKKMFDYK